VRRRSIGSGVYACVPPSRVPAWGLESDSERREPEQTLLHQVVREQLEGFIGGVSSGSAATSPGHRLPPIGSKSDRMEGSRRAGEIEPPRSSWSEESLLNG